MHNVQTIQSEQTVKKEIYFVLLTPECEDAIIEGDVPIIENRLSRVIRVKGEKQLRESEHEVLVKEIQNALSDSYVIQSTMV